MKRILITGGAGFIGSHLCERLLNEGNDIICLDNFYTGAKDNIRHLIGNNKFELVRHDVIFDYFAEIDQIYNLACPASPVHYQHDPIKTIKTSVMGIINMLELAKRCNARILQASTSEVYGNPLIHPQIESYWGNVNPIGIRSCYDEGKRCAETLMADYYRQNKTDIRIARIFNTYGPRMALNDGRVVSNFIIQALKNEPVTIYGSGNQTRAFCYVSDIVEALILLMNKDYSYPVNIGNPIEYSILDFAKLIIELTNSSSEIIYKELPADDPIQRKPNIEIAKEKLNWKPKISIKEGLLKTINYFNNVLYKNN